MTQTLRRHYTLAEYYALERTSLEKHEYFRGEIYEMSKGSSNHSRISLNAGNVLDRALEAADCVVFQSDLQVQIDTEDGIFATYPDVSVVCGPIEYADERDDVILNPALIVEVLSPATANYDRNGKFKKYMQIPALRDYILIDQKQVEVTHYRRVEEGWLLRLYTKLDTTIELVNLGIIIPIERLYSRVELKTPVRLRPKRPKQG